VRTCHSTSHHRFAQVLTSSATSAIGSRYAKLRRNIDGESFLKDLATNPPLDGVTLESVMALHARGVREGKTLEYKRDLLPLNDKAKFELIKDVCAFANADGGLLVYGAEQGPDGAIAALPGVEIDDRDKLESQITLLLRDNIDERPIGVTIAFLSIPNSTRVVVLVRVPRSYLAPHMITLPVTHPRFYQRSGTVNVPLEMAQVRTLTTARYRMETEAVNRIHERTRFGGPSSVMCFAVPLFSHPYALDFTNESLLRQLLTPAAVLGGGSTFHTLVGYGMRYYQDEHRQHVLFTRGGGVEVLYAPITYVKGDHQFLRLKQIENVVQRFLEAVSTAAPLGVAPLPVLLALRLSGVAGTHAGSPEGFPLGYPCSDDDVFPEPEVIYSWDEAWPTMKRYIDVLWQACGVRKSPSFDQ